MEPPYSAFADLLNKFHTVAPAIQALWLVALAGTILGVTWLVMRGLRDIAAVVRRPGPGSLLVYGVVQDAGGRWHVIRHGSKPQPVDWTNPPRELVASGSRREALAARSGEPGSKDREDPASP